MRPTSFYSRRQPQETTVFVRYTNKTTLNIKEENQLREQVNTWLMEHTDYRIEFGSIDGTRVGVYLEPQDALALRLAFGIL
jgi:hypothetical protein